MSKFQPDLIQLSCLNFSTVSAWYSSVHPSKNGFNFALDLNEDQIQWDLTVSKHHILLGYSLFYPSVPFHIFGKKKKSKFSVYAL